MKQWRARKQRGPSQEASLLNSSTGINKKTPDHKQPKQMVWLWVFSEPEADDMRTDIFGPCMVLKGR